MANTLKFKRGLVATIPTAALAEPLFTTDTFDLYIGNGTGNTRFQKYIASGATTQILRGDGSLYSFPLAISSPSNGQVLKFNGTSWVNDTDLNSGTVTSVGLTSSTTGITITGSPVTTSGNLNFEIATASGSATGLLSSTDWTTFNNKQNALTFGNLSETGSSILTISGGTGAVIGSGTTIQVAQASGSTSGFLSSTDWTTFNNKQSALTNPVTGTGTSGQVAYWSGTTTQTGSSTFLFSPTSELDLANSVTAATAIARGARFRPTLFAAANNDVLVGLDVNPTFTNGAFTGVSNYALRLNTASATGAWNLYASGTANNYLAGSLGVGTTISLSTYKLFVVGRQRNENNVNASSELLDLVNTDTGTSNYVALRFLNGVGTGQILYTGPNTTGYGFANTLMLYQAASNPIQFTTNNTVRATITGGGNLLVGSTSDSGLRFQVTGDGYFSGSVGIGTTSLTGFNLRIAKNITGGAIQKIVNQDGTVQSDVTNLAFGFMNSARTAAASFTLPNYYHFYAEQYTLGAGSAITNQFGFVADNTLTGATNNYGFYGNIASGTGRWNLYMNGTANNYMAGSLGIGTASPAYRLQVDGASTAGFVTPLLLKNPSTNAASAVKMAFDGGGTIWGEIGSSYNSNAPYMAFFVRANSEKMRITDAGNIGIGTLTPTAYGAYTTLSINNPNDGAVIDLLQNNTRVGSIYTSVAGAGLNINTVTSNPLIFLTNNAERMRIDASGNLGIGVTPSAWNSGVRMIEFIGGSFGSNNTPAQVYINSNAYLGASNWIYNASNFAAQYQVVNGQFQWLRAPSGTAGNAITWTTAMTLTTNGRLLLGTTTESTFLLDVNGTARVSGAATFGSDGIFGNTATTSLNERLNVTGNGIVVEAVDAGSRMLFGHFGSANGIMGTFTNDQLQIRTNNVTRLTIENTGAATFSSSVTAASFIPSGSTVPTNGMYLPTTNTLAWATNSAVRMTLDASGNLGLGVTPSAWNSFKAIQLGGSTYSAIGSTNGYMLVTANAFFDGAGFKYVSSSAASRYLQNGGAHSWDVATSGTAGNAITFTTAMTLAATGNLLVGTTTDAGYRLDVNGTARVSGQVTGNSFVPTSSTIPTNGMYLSAANTLDFATNTVNRLSISTTAFTYADAMNFAFGTTTGTKIGTSTSQKISLWNATPDVQPTTAITAAAFVANTSGIVDDTATFGGYTIGQIVAALKRIGALA